MLDNLKPCPFCGGGANYRWQQCMKRGKYYLFYFIECEMCGAKTKARFVDDKGQSEQEIWDSHEMDLCGVAWNRRTAE